MTPALRLRSLALGRGTFRLGPLDGEVPVGSVLAVLGASGSGKSTLLDLVAGVEAWDGGALEIDGRAMGGRRPVPAHRRGVAYLTQESGLWTGLNAGENVALVARAHGTSDRVGAVLAALDATALAGRAPASLSGGEARRIALARVLVVPAPLVLLDEPGAHLGHGASERAAWVVRETVDARRGTLVVTGHDLDAVSAYDPGHLWILDRGTLVASGPIAAVEAAPGHRSVAERVGFGVFLEARSEGGVWVGPWGSWAGPSAFYRRPQLALRTGTLRVDPEGTLRGRVAAPAQLPDGRPGTRVVVGEAQVAVAIGRTDVVPGATVALTVEGAVVVEGSDDEGQQGRSRSGG